MIALIGDIHGNFKFLRTKVAELAKEHGEIPIIQVGDFGYWAVLKEKYLAPPSSVLFIDGNHDDCKALIGLPPAEWEKPVELWENAIYVPRATVMVVDGLTVLFMGGAKSVDRRARNKDVGFNSWSEEEVIRPRDHLKALLAIKGKKIDLMVTHTPPQWMVDKHFLGGQLEFGHGLDWRDPSAQYVEDLWKAADCPPLYCGHMHQSVTDGVCRILGIQETVVHEA